MSLAYALLAAVAALRLIELFYAARNTRALLERGANEFGRGIYPLFIVLHAAWLLSIAVFLPQDPIIHWPALGIFGLLQLLRLWVIASLGPYWTTRIISIPGAPLVRCGAYRFVRHPNYMIVAAEIAALPLVFGEEEVALIFSILNAVLLAIRIRQEEAALAPRRAPPQTQN